MSRTPGTGGEIPLVADPPLAKGSIPFANATGELVTDPKIWVDNGFSPYVLVGIGVDPSTFVGDSNYSLLLGQLSVSFDSVFNRIFGGIDYQDINTAGTAIQATIGKGSIVGIRSTAVTPLTLTGTPTIVSDAASLGEDGQLLFLFNGTSVAVTLQDNATLVGSLLRLKAATVTLTPLSAGPGTACMLLIFSASSNVWLQVA